MSQITSALRRWFRPALQPWWAAAGLILAMVWMYGPILDFEFLNYGQPDSPIQESVVRTGLSEGGVAWAFRTGIGTEDWMPLTRLSHMLDVQRHGLEEARGHFATNLFFYAAALLGGFLFFLKKTKFPSGAFLYSLLLLYPFVGADVVASLEGRDILAGAAFSLWAWWLWEKGIRKRGGWRELFLALLLFVLALLFHPAVCTMPLVFFLSAIAGKQSWRSLFLGISPFILVALVTVWLAVPVESWRWLLFALGLLFFGELGREQWSKELTKVQRRMPLILFSLIMVPYLIFPLFQLSKWKDDESFLRYQMRAGPDQLSAHLQFGQMRLDQERLKEAEEAFRQAQSLYPDSGIVICRLGEVFEAKGRLFEALDYYQQAVAKNLSEPRPYRNLVRLAMSSRDRTKAEHWVAEGLKSFPKDAGLMNDSGAIALGMKKDAGLAISRYQAVLAMYPKNATARQGLALSLIEEGDYEKGISLLMELLDEDPSRSDIRDFLQMNLQ